MKTSTDPFPETGVSFLASSHPEPCPVADAPPPDSPPANVADEIHRLCAQVGRHGPSAVAAMPAVMTRVWRIGKLLLEEKARVRAQFGAGAWLKWLERSFPGTPRSAQRYMRLVRNAPNLSFISDLTLNQAYLRLGVAVSHAKRGGSARGPSLPPYAVLARRLLGELPDGLPTAAEKADYERHLRALHTRLGELLGG